MYGTKSRWNNKLKHMYAFQGHRTRMPIRTRGLYDYGEGIDDNVFDVPPMNQDEVSVEIPEFNTETPNLETSKQDTDFDLPPVSEPYMMPEVQQEPQPTPLTPHQLDILRNLKQNDYRYRDEASIRQAIGYDGDTNVLDLYNKMNPYDISDETPTIEQPKPSSLPTTRIQVRRQPKPIQRTEPTFDNSHMPKEEADSDYDDDADEFLRKTDAYPFKSKLKVYNEMYNQNLQSKPVSDKKNINLRPMYRPTYSPYPHSWQMDIMFTPHKYYLVLVNINTRYLIIKHIQNKSAETILYTLNGIIKDGVEIGYINGDAEPGFIGAKANYEANRSRGGNHNAIYPVLTESNGMPLTIYSKNIIMRFVNEPYSFHNKMVDSVIRTVRNAAGLNPRALDDPDIMNKIINMYNGTPHTGLLKFTDSNGVRRNYTPNEMENNIDLEWEYIRSKDRELANKTDTLIDHGYNNYKPGNILGLYLHRGKTRRRFQKRRMNYENIGIFLGYHNGNARVYIVNSGEGKRGDAKADGTRIAYGSDEEKDVPLFYTKFLAESADKLDPSVAEYMMVKRAFEKLKQQGVLSYQGQSIPWYVDDSTPMVDDKQPETTTPDIQEDIPDTQPEDTYENTTQDTYENTPQETYDDTTQEKDINEFE